MPIYHFVHADGVRYLNKTGVELPDDAAARLTATQFAAEVLRFSPSTFLEEGRSRVEVTNRDNALLFTVLTIAVEGP